MGQTGARPPPPGVEAPGAWKMAIFNGDLLGLVLTGTQKRPPGGGECPLGTRPIPQVGQKQPGQRNNEQYTNLKHFHHFFIFYIYSHYFLLFRHEKAFDIQKICM